MKHCNRKSNWEISVENYSHFIGDFSSSEILLFRTSILTQHQNAGNQQINPK